MFGIEFIGGAGFAASGVSLAFLLALSLFSLMEVKPAGGDVTKEMMEEAFHAVIPAKGTKPGEAAGRDPDEEPGWMNPAKPDGGGDPGESRKAPAEAGKEPAAKPATAEETLAEMTAALKEHGYDTRFKGPKEIVQAFADLEKRLTSAAERYKITDADKVGGVLSRLEGSSPDAMVKMMELFAEKLAGKGETKEPAEKPYELSAALKSISEKYEDWSPEFMKEFTDGLVEYLAGHPKLKGAILGDLPQNLKLLSESQVESAWDRAWSDFLKEYPKEKFPKVHELKPKTVIDYLDQNRSLIEYANKSSKNPFKVAVQMMNEEGKLAGLLEATAKAAHEEGADAAARLKEATETSGAAKPGGTAPQQKSESEMTAEEYIQHKFGREMQGSDIQKLWSGK